MTKQKKTRKQISDMEDVEISKKKPSERNVRDYARQFYRIMREVPKDTFVNCTYLHEKLDEIGWSLEGNPHSLWRVWRQAEAEFPGSIDFIPQSTVLWNKAPAGWRYTGPPQYELRKKRKRIK